MKSIVLLSGGMDSTVNFYEALNKGSVLLSLTFDYGQRAVAKEIESAKKISQLHSVPHQVISLPFFKNWGQSSLTNRTQELPLNNKISIDDLQVSKKTAQSVWVPNRNGIFLNIAAGFAESLQADNVIPGFNIEEAATFADNSLAFTLAMNESLSYSTANKVKIECFTLNLNKTQIVKRGNELKVNWSLIWPCYQEFNQWCGQCESCQRAKRAFAANNINFEELR